MTESVPVSRWGLIAACVIAGALAVPPHTLASAVSAIVTGLLGLLGLRVWAWSRLPVRMKSAAPRGPARWVRPVVWMGLGLIVGLVVLGVIRLAIQPHVPAAGARIELAGALPVWRRLLVVYVAAVGEELLFRLLLLSLVAGSIARLSRAPDHVPAPLHAALANGLAAIAFAAAHLPAWSGVGASGPGLALAVLSLNALGGIVLGYVFVNHGIVPAMWTHAGADCAIQLIGPLTG